MSRIQDILAKAERDGTARRTQSESSLSAAAVAVVAPIDGAVALNRTPFMPTPVPSPVMSPVAIEDRLADERPAAVDTRTARATLHPALVAAIAPHSAVAEQYRAVRSRLMLRDDHGVLRTIMVTSPGPRDGKSITAGNLALTMAQEVQRNIILVDADLRKPSVHALFGIEGTPGLGDVLAGSVTLEEALIYLPDYRLTILPAGSSPQFPTELLGSGAMRRALDTLRVRFDRILLDLPAVAPLADVSSLAPLVDGALMVVRAGTTQRPALEQALTVFEEKKVVGVVLNEAR